MLGTLGAVGIAKLLLQVMVLCLIVYEVIVNIKFLRVANKKRALLIYMFVFAIFVVLLWTFLMFCDKSVNRYTTLIAAYMILHSIPREMKQKTLN